MLPNVVESVEFDKVSASWSQYAVNCPFQDKVLRLFEALQKLLLLFLTSRLVSINFSDGFGPLLDI